MFICFTPARNCRCQPEGSNRHTGRFPDCRAFSLTDPFGCFRFWRRALRRPRPSHVTAILIISDGLRPGSRLTTGAGGWCPGADTRKSRKNAGECPSNHRMRSTGEFSRSRPARPPSPLPAGGSEVPGTGKTILDAAFPGQCRRAMPSFGVVPSRMIVLSPVERPANRERFWRFAAAAARTLIPTASRSSNAGV